MRPPDASRLGLADRRENVRVTASILRASSGKDLFGFLSIRCEDGRCSAVLPRQGELSPGTSPKARASGGPFSPFLTAIERHLPGPRTTPKKGRRLPVSPEGAQDGIQVRHAAGESRHSDGEPHVP